MVRRHYLVLAAISHCYSKPKGRFPRVTHPCATHPEGFVRLACVRHAASVRSEPGSNSQVCVTHQTGTTEVANLQGKSFKEPIPALSNVMDTNEHASSHGKRGVFRGCGVGLVTRYCDLEFRRRGAVAHMSLHQKPTISKSHQTDQSGQLLVPRFTPGEPAVRLVLATEAVWRWKPSAPRRWSPSRRGPRFGQRLFAILFRGSGKNPKTV